MVQVNVMVSLSPISFFVNLFLIFTVFRYTTDGGVRENLEKGSIRGDAVFSGENFSLLMLI